MFMSRTLIALVSVATLATTILAAQTQPAAKPLEIYVVDVEGGKADIWVTPAGQTLLIDTGNPGTRDVDRIMEVAAAAGVTKLDYLISTHYHVDHVGGLQELVKRLPVGTFVDHGPTAEEREQVAGFQAAYAELYGKAKHLVVKPGDRIPLTGVDWRIVISDGQPQKAAIPGVPGTGPNANCAGVTRSTLGNGGEENARSVGSLVTIGAFRLLDMGDLTGEKEFDLVCPNNPIGTVDLFRASNHGTNNANLAFFLHSIAPRVVVVQNAAGKGASVDMFRGLHSSPGFQDAWLLHWGNAAGAEWNPPGAFIANGMDAAAIAASITAPPPAPRGGGGGRAGGGAPGAPGAAGPGVGAPAAAPGAGPAPAAAPEPGGAPAAGAPAAGAAGPQGGGQPGVAGAPGAARGGGGGGRGAAQPPHTPAHWVKISVAANGTYTVTNTRNNFSKTYTAVMARAAAPARGAATR
jgi:competence protein ComEC